MSGKTDPESKVREIRRKTRLGASCSRNVTKQTNVLVIGTFGSRDWIQSSFGRKIEKAVQYREEGVPLVILSEDQWAFALPAEAD